MVGGGKIERRHCCNYVFFFKGIDTAKYASDQLETHLLETLNHMLCNQANNLIKSGAPVCSSQLNLDQLRYTIKQTYFQLDQDLRKVVKDESGCVCVCK